MTPLPDENCYSVLCRCIVREAYSTRRFSFQMFGGKRDLSRFLFQPFRFDDLSRWFADAETRQKEYLDRHSVFQYCYPMLCKPWQRLIMDWRNCISLYSSDLKVLTRAVGLSLVPKKDLCYCRECVQEDRRTYGETYWHLSHQLPGIRLCPIHDVPLNTSAIEISKTRYVLFPADYVLRKDGQDATLEGAGGKYDETVSKDSMWLIHHGFELDEEKCSQLRGSVADNVQEKIRAEIQNCTGSLIDLPCCGSLGLILLCRILGQPLQNLSKSVSQL